MSDRTSASGSLAAETVREPPSGASPVVVVDGTRNLSIAGKRDHRLGVAARKLFGGQEPPPDAKKAIVDQIQIQKNIDVYKVAG